jgi:SAM-dependent methyltransferase
MRTLIHKLYLNNFKRGDRLLELNSGTGIDAVFLAHNGIKVFATDISPRMIDELELKVKSKGLSGEIQYDVKSFNELSNIKEDNFDGVISNFGGLNCIPDFSKLSDDLYSKLKPGGKIIAAVINKFCPWEMFLYSLKFNFRTAFRRFSKNGTDANLNGGKVRTFYFTPGSFAKFFKPNFKVDQIYSHCSFTPPPYLKGFYNKLRPVAKVLMKIDELTRGIFPFNRFGDHFIIILTKK